MTDGDVTMPRAAWEAVLAEQAALRGRVEALESVERIPMTTASSSTAAPPSGATTTSPPSSSIVGRRRALVGLAGAAVGSVATTLATAGPAAAVTGDHLVAGGTTTFDQTTILDGRDVAGGYGVRIRQDGAQTALGLETTGGQALFAYSTAPNTNATATVVVENAGNGRTLELASNGAHIHFLSDSTTTPPAQNIARKTNDLQATDAGDLWYCVEYGTPGTWRKVVGKGTAGALHVLPVPIRIYDSRAGTSPDQGPKTKLSGNTARTLDLKANASGVPAGATAALVTVLLVDATNANGNFTIWAAGATRPQSNTLVWGGSAGRFTTSTVTALDAQARCQASASIATNLVIDVVGYYR